MCRTAKVAAAWPPLLWRGWAIIWSTAQLRHRGGGHLTPSALAGRAGSTSRRPPVGPWRLHHRVAGKLVEEPQVVTQVSGGEETVPHDLAAAHAHLLGRLWIAQQFERAVNALVHAVDQKSGDPVLDLQRNAADIAADDRPPLPQAFRDRQSEALAQRLL